MGSTLLKYFKYDHLPSHLQEISKPFYELAKQIDMFPSFDLEERELALRKLLEAKDCAVRSLLR